MSRVTKNFFKFEIKFNYWKWAELNLRDIYKKICKMNSETCKAPLASCYLHSRSNIPSRHTKFAMPDFAKQIQTPAPKHARLTTVHWTAPSEVDSPTSTACCCHWSEIKSTAHQMMSAKAGFRQKKIFHIVT